MTHDRASWYYFVQRRGRKVNRKIDGLQRHTATVTECAWPDCDKSTPKTFAESRLGVLCLDHAWSHYDAMNSFLVWDGTTDSSYVQSLVASLKAKQVPLDAYTDEERGEIKEALESGWVYYLRVGDQVKIGFSSNVHQRMRSYPPGSKLLAIEPGDKKLERRRHNEFGEWLVAGREWFQPSDQLIQHTRDLFTMHGDPRHYAHNYREPVWRQERRQPMRLRRQY